MADSITSNDRAGIFETGDTINLRQLVTKRWKLIVVTWGLIVALCLIYCLAATPTYDAATTIIIDKEDASQGSLRDAMMPMISMISSGMTGEYLQTVCKVLESQSVAYNVIQRLNLEHNKDFFSNEATLLTRLLDIDLTDKATVRDLLIKGFQKKLKIQPILKTQCVQITFTSKNAALSAVVANAVVEAYREHAFAMKIDSIRNSADWLKGNLEQERKKIEASEQALMEYQEKNDIIMEMPKDPQNPSPSSSLAMKQMAELDVMLVKAGSERAEAETRYRQAASIAGRPDMLDSVPEIHKSDLITKIKTMEAEVLRNKAELAKKYGPLHPQMIALESELKTMEGKKDQEIKRIIGALKSEYEAKLAKEKTIKADLEARKAEFFKMGKSARELTGLYVDAAGSRLMYALLLREFKQAEVKENLKIGNIRIVDKAEPPIKPTSPKKLRVMFVAVFFGLFAGLGAALLLEYLGNASIERRQTSTRN